MPNWFDRLVGGGRLAAESKGLAGPRSLMSITSLGEASWSRRGFVSLASAGFMRNPVVYRATRLVAEAANRVPLVVVDNQGRRQAEHPLAALLRRPNRRQSGSELLEAVYAYLQTAGNAYLEAVLLDGEVRELHVLRPDRVRAVTGRDGYPRAYEYAAGGRRVELPLDQSPVSAVLHLALFHPLDDHYGLAPLEAAAQSLDIHNGAAEWNKALLDNAARPSGALVYSAGGTLTEAQFRRLKEELEGGFQGAANAGRPMVLEGGLDWKPMALTPAEMDFVGLKDSAARDIALAFGVPPQLLGIPGDNTYTNLAEANRALWRHTVVPLVRRVADDLGFWLAPGFGGARLEPDFDGVEALAEDRAGLWARVGAAEFLSDAEKREMLGVA